MDDAECGCHAKGTLTACGSGAGSDFQRRPQAERQGSSLARLGQALSGLVDRSNTEGGVRKVSRGEMQGEAACFAGEASG